MEAHLVIVTGASRGLGLAMAQQLLARPGTELLAIARHPAATLDAVADGRLTQWALDLAHPLEAAARLESWLAQRHAQRYGAATLINNAAAITPPGPVQDLDDAQLSDALRVGLEAPVLLTASFLRATRGWHAARKVLNISSGLGRRAMGGQAAYCAVKAGLDNFTHAVALDEARQPNGAKLVSLAPGVIDTDMQVALRGSDPDRFPDRASFVALKERGQLWPPQEAAARVLAYLDRSDFGARPVADVRE